MTERENILGVYRYLLTNPNSDNQVYTHETEALKEIISKLNKELITENRQVTIFPGHGEYYRPNLPGNAKYNINNFPVK